MTPNIERNEIFDLAYRFVTETSENIFLTGKAGTGKTTFLKFLKENCTKNIVVAAPTGVAAINAGGVTLHSLFQLPFHPFLPTKTNRDELLGKIRYNRERQQLLRKMELLVIDEISMVRCDVMDAIDAILRSIRRNYDMPFGGVQLLCIGDLHQLPPVAQQHEWNILQEYYASPFFFDSLAVKEQMPLLIELDKIYRQKEDSFVSLLNKIRNNNMTADDFEDLHLRFNPNFKPTDDEKYITLASHNKQADHINQMEIQRILSPAYKYNAVVENDFAENLYPVEFELSLKVGAQVMFLKNDNVYKRFFNGKIGVVKSLDKEEVIVDCDGFDINVTPETWENSRYTLNKSDGKLEQDIIGTFTQYPLRLAWAITIHKSQGLTFDKIMIDAGSAFSSGQVYVGLSRCTSLEGIVLLSKIPSAAIYSNENVVKGQQSLMHKGSLAERFAGARQVFTQQLLEEIFSFKDVNIALELLYTHLKQQKDKFNIDAVNWVEALKNDLASDLAFGYKFTHQVAALMKDEPEIEKNIALQSRIKDAATYFEKRFSLHQEAIKNHPLITEHKEAAMIVNEFLLQLLVAAYTTNYYLQYCKEDFSVTHFLQHKLKFALPRFNITCYASGKKQSYGDIPNVELYDTLKRWRDMVCEDTKQPIYLIANQNTLREISTFLPFTKKDLLQISGFGKAKVDKYGEEILENVQDYCSRHSIESNMAAKENNPKKERKEKSTEVKTDTKTQSYNLYKEGKSVAEIAKERNFSPQTIEGHLAWFVGNGDIDVTEFVSEAKQDLIKKAVAKFGNISHKTLIDSLPADITYGDIRMLLAAQKATIE